MAGGVSTIEDIYSKWIWNNLITIKWQDFHFGDIYIPDVLADVSNGRPLDTSTSINYAVTYMIVKMHSERDTEAKLYGAISDSEMAAHREKEFSAFNDLVILISKVRYLLKHDGDWMRREKSLWRFTGLRTYCDERSDTLLSSVSTNVNKVWNGANAYMHSYLMMTLGFSMVCERYGGYVSEHRDITRVLNDLNNAGLDKGITFHMLRHLDPKPNDPVFQATQYKLNAFQRMFCNAELEYFKSKAMIVDKVKTKDFVATLDYFRSLTLDQPTFVNTSKLILSINEAINRSFTGNIIIEYMDTLDDDEMHPLEIFQSIPKHDIQLPWFVWIYFLTLSANASAIPYRLTLSKFKEDILQW